MKFKALIIDIWSFSATERALKSRVSSCVVKLDLTLLCPKYIRSQIHCTNVDLSIVFDYHDVRKLAKVQNND